MKHTLALSMIPAVLAWAAHTPAPLSKGYFSAAAIEVKTTLPENITARRMDEDTFRLRWSGVAAMPPAIEVHYVRDDVVDAGTVALLPPAPPPSRQLSAQSALRNVRTMRTDICHKHGMRRVNYGKRWRCRR